MPLAVSTFWATRILERAFGGERMLGLAGCAMACASGSFALYMTLHGPSVRSSPSQDFTVFAQFAASRRPEGVTRVDMADASSDIDPIVTGSIPKAGDRSAPAKPVLPNIKLRQVDGDSAMVEIRGRVMVYRVGDRIPGGGLLLAMTRQNGRPVVETSKGFIVGSY